MGQDVAVTISWLDTMLMGLFVWALCSAISETKEVTIVVEAPPAAESCP